MTYTLTPDPVAFATSLKGLIATAVANYAASLSVANWLPTGSITLTTPATPYPQASPKPFGVLRFTGHSASVADESGTTGNIPGKPNSYTLYYYELAYAGASTRSDEELRCVNTYAAIATAFLTGDGDNTIVCPPDEHATVVSVEPLIDPNGPFLLFGEETWIGIAIRITIDEQYN